MKRRIIMGLIILIMISGIGLMVYPSLANFINNQFAISTIGDYTSKVENYDKEEIDKKEKQYIELSNKLKEEVKKEVNTFSIILIVFFIIIFVLFQIIDENLITININNNIKIAIKWISLFISIVGIVFDINIKQCKNKKVNEIVAKKLLKKYNITSKNNKGY